MTILAALMGVLTTAGIGAMLRAAGLRHTGAHMICEFVAATVVALAGLAVTRWMAVPTVATPKTTDGWYAWGERHGISRATVAHAMDNMMPRSVKR